MNISLYTLTSPLHDQKAVDAASAEFLAEIESKLGFSFDFRGHDFSGYGTGNLDVIYVRTGGTEGLFEEVFPTLKGNILLLTSGKSNSLAASMEILSYLNQKGRQGEIIHGSTDYIAERLKVLAQVQAARKSLNGKKLGVIGQPSDWLISSNPDAEALKAKLGVNLVHVPIEELIDIVLSDEDLSAYSHRSMGQDSGLGNPDMTEITAQIPSTIQKYTSGDLLPDG